MRLPLRTAAKSTPRRLDAALRPAPGSALALFQDVVGRTAETRTPPDLAPPEANSALDEVQLAERMKQLLQLSLPVAEKLPRFRDEIWPLIDAMPGLLPKHLYMSTASFLGQACDAVVDEGLPGFSLDLSSMYSRIGRWDLDVRNRLVLSLCYQLLANKQLAPADRAALLQELIQLWKHISQLRRKSQSRNARLRFVLPSVDEVLRDMSTGRRPPGTSVPATKALASIFIQFRREQASFLIPGLLATLALLSDPGISEPAMQKAAAPLLHLVAAILQQTEADESQVAAAVAATVRFPPLKLAAIQSYVVQQWPALLQMLSPSDSAWRSGLAASGALDAPSQSTLASIHRKLRVAYRSRNLEAATVLWRDMRALMSQNAALASQLAADAEFVDFWIFIWCAFRLPSNLQQTLQMMHELGMSPTVRSYTAMMHGWKMSKDADRMVALWDRLAASSLRLDNAIWTERISGLIEAGRARDGIQALAEMQALWDQAVREKGESLASQTAVRPSIEAVNAAFTGLLRRDHAAAHEVLAWASRQGIEPNVRTYNLLLREGLRNGNPEEIHNLLAAMRRQGVDPDAATFTVILEGVLGAIDGNAPAAEQVRAVEQVLADIKAAGLQANQETYGKMLHAVTSLVDGGADEAVAAVQKHMRAAGLAISPHMVTILLERLMASGNLSPGAIKALLEEHKLTQVGQGDQTLWERVTSAYAAAGDASAAMAVFDKLASTGRPLKPLWCLAELLKALLAAGSREEARRVVEAALAHRPSQRDSDAARDERYWRHHFWHMAKEHGLLREDELPPGMRGMQGGP